MNSTVTCGACKHSGSDFEVINFILNSSVMTIEGPNEKGSKSEKTLTLYVCPKCKTVQKQ